MPSARPRVVIAGGGFGGLAAARALKRAKVDLTLIDRENHHLFQPLLYQIATASLSAADIAAPIRSVLAHQKNAEVLMADVRGVDLARRKVTLERGALDYDFLVLAAGAESTYFGHDEWEPSAPSLKNLEDALEIRRRVLLAYEEAEREPDARRRRILMGFVVIGAGPTGVELAGALAELAHTVLPHDFRRIDPARAEVRLVEAGPRVLPTFPPQLTAKAIHQLETLGVKVITGARVVAIDAHGVTIGGGGRLEAATVIWAAGVKPARIGRALGVPTDKTGRVLVNEDLSIPGYPEAFVVGDLAMLVQSGRPLPGLSPVAMQEGRAAARAIVRTLRGKPTRHFHYVDKGTIATIGRGRAVADSPRPAPQRMDCLDRLGVRAHLVSHRLPQSLHRHVQLGLVVPDVQARGAGDHEVSAATRLGRGRGAGEARRGEAARAPVERVRLPTPFEGPRTPRRTGPSG